MNKWMLVLLFPPSLALAYGDLDQEGCAYGGKILNPGGENNEKSWRKVPVDFTGEKLCYHRNGKISKKTAYVKGVEEGLAVTYDEAGDKREEYQVLHGKRHGLFKQYNHATKKLEREMNYVEGRQEGLIRSYDSKTGSLEQVQMVTPKGDGTRIYYTKSGDIQSVSCKAVSAIPEDDAFCGRHGMGKTFKEHFEEGPVSRVLQYRNLQLHGEVKRFSLDGRLLSTERYENGKSVGYEDANADGSKGTEKIVGGEIVQTRTFPSGKIKAERRLDAGNRALKEEKIFFENGRLSTHSKVEGEITRVQEYFDTGQKSCSFGQRGTGYSRTLEGVYECFDEKERPRFRNVYLRDRLDGEQKYYDPNGKLYQRQIYANGKIKTTIEYGADGKVTDQYDHEPDGSRKVSTKGP